MNEKVTAACEHVKIMGLPSLLAFIAGIAISQVGLVGILRGIAQMAGQKPWFIGGTFLVALLLALTYAETFSELALMMPRAGGLSTYAEAGVGHFPALLATFSGYVVVSIFGLSAELILIATMATVGVLGIVGVCSAVWVRMFMKRGLFEPVPRHLVTARGDAPPGSAGQ